MKTAEPLPIRLASPGPAGGPINILAGARVWMQVNIRCRPVDVRQR
jgi:hypothetical protein